MRETNVILIFTRPWAFHQVQKKAINVFHVENVNHNAKSGKKRHKDLFAKKESKFDTLENLDQNECQNLTSRKIISPFVKTQLENPKVFPVS